MECNGFFGGVTTGSFFDKGNSQMQPDLLFSDWQRIIRNKLGKDQWVIVYSYHSNEYERICFYSALIPDRMVDSVLDRQSWDLGIGEGLPGHIFRADTEKTQYCRFIVKYAGIEPLIFCRDFHGIRESYREVSEEFRHYYNLYYDGKTGKHIMIDNSGDEDDVIIYNANEIRIKLRYIKEFLSMKDMHLAIYFDLDRFSSRSLQDLGLKEVTHRIKKNKYTYCLTVFDGEKPSSRLYGKKLIEGGEKPIKSLVANALIDEENKKYLDFIIDVDEEGMEVYYTCNPAKLADDFGVNSEVPNYLTLVFFKREVLNKYYSNPAKFSVEDGYLRCKGIWGLRLDNNHPKYVVVFLGDLGDLNTKEQHYWRRFNIAPDGIISSVAYKRQILGQFAEPAKSDLLFKDRFYSFQKGWFQKFGWHLFKPLSKNDEHLYKTLRLPLTDDQDEFDQQILSLAKSIIDSLNDEELEKVIGKERNDKSITKLRKYLSHHKLHDFDRHIEFLRRLQDLRNGAVHRKGKDYLRGSAYFRLDEKILISAFDDILRCAISFIEYLDTSFLK